MFTTYFNRNFETALHLGRIKFKKGKSLYFTNLAEVARIIFTVHNHIHEFIKRYKRKKL